MTRKNFITLLLGVVGGILFAIGMCMCLLPEWNAFSQGVVVAIIGAVVLLALLLVRRRMDGKPAIRLTGKAIGTIALAVVGSLVLGVGMCLCMVWDELVFGILLGVVGIVLLLCLIPAIKGLN